MASFSMSFIRSPTNKGNLPKYYVEGSHEAIIDKDVFLRVQAEIARRANITPDGKKRIYSSRYALSSIVFCGHCGDIYRRIKWNNRGCKSTVWRCVSRVLKKDSGIDCPARTLREEDLHAAVLTAVNDAWSRKADIMPALKENIEAVLDGGVEDAISEIDAKIKEKQQELLEAGHDDALIDSIGAEIIDLREKHQELMTNVAKQQELQERLEDLDNFLDEQTEAMDSLCQVFREQSPILPVCFKRTSVLMTQGAVETITPTAANPFYGLKDWKINFKK